MLPQIDIGRKLGEGSFGEVLLGNFRGTKVCNILKCSHATNSMR
jgi:hypothetical protein